MTFSDFFDTLGDLDWLAIVVAAVAVFLLAWLWYGPLFGKAWLTATGRQQETPEPAVFVQGLYAFFVLNIGIAYFIPALHAATQTPSSIETLIVSAVMLGLFVAGMVMANRAIWEDGKWTLWAINTGFFIVAIAVGAYVQDLMA